MAVRFTNNNYLYRNEYAWPNVSLCAWAKLRSDISPQNLFGISNYLSTFYKGLVYQFYLNSVRVIFINDEQRYSFVGQNSVDVDSWFHIGVTFNGVTVTHYLNGVAVGGSDVSGPFTVNCVNCGAVRRFESYAGCVADIERFRIHNVTLNDSEIFQIYNNQNVTRGLWGYWPLIEDYLDYSGNGRNLSAYGTVNFVEGPPLEESSSSSSSEFGIVGIPTNLHEILCAGNYFEMTDVVSYVEKKAVRGYIDGFC